MHYNLLKGITYLTWDVLLPFLKAKNVSKALPFTKLHPSRINIKRFWVQLFFGPLWGRLRSPCKLSAFGRLLHHIRTGSFAVIVRTILHYAHYCIAADIQHIAPKAASARLLQLALNLPKHKGTRASRAWHTCPFHDPKPLYNNI